MPRQNRVTPFGDLIAVTDRGLMFGNRGVLHDSEQRIVRNSRGRRWIVCALEFRGRHREVMQPNRYTELFFLDEATALAAGHRPCAECRYRDYQHFRRCWASAHDELAEILPSADQIDARLHLDRVTTTGARKTYVDEIGALPDGVFIVRNDEPWLIRGKELLRWTPAGYDRQETRPSRGQMTVLTPRGTVRTIVAGYQPSTALRVEDDAP